MAHRKTRQQTERDGVRTAKVAQERAESVSFALRLPAITDAYARTMLEEMRRSHLANIDACEAALDGLPAG